MSTQVKATATARAIAPVVVPAVPTVEAITTALKSTPPAPDTTPATTVTIMSGRSFVPAILDKELANARAIVGRMSTGRDAGTKHAGTAKAGGVAWSGAEYRGAKSKHEARALAIVKAGEALARALALPTS